MLMKSQLRWAGHVARMPDNRLPKKLLFGELTQGKRSRGAPKKRFKDSLKASLKAFEIIPDTWESDAQDRSGWRGALHAGAERLEEKRLETAITKRNARKERDSRPPVDACVPCPHCNRMFRARIGLISHLRTHKTVTTPLP